MAEDDNCNAPGSIPPLGPALVPHLTDQSAALQAPQMPLPIDWNSDVFVAGFHDCALEAIHYLTAVEHFEPSDTVLSGLCAYLQHKQNELGDQRDNTVQISGVPLDLAQATSTPNRTAEGNINLCPRRNLTSDLSLVTPQESAENQQSSHINPFSDSSLYSESLDSSCPDSSTSAQEQSSTADEHSAMDTTMSSVAPDDSVSDLSRSLEADTSTNIQSLGGVVASLPVTSIPSGLSLASLAQSNPAIMSLTSQLMHLIQGGDITDDDDSDDMDDVINHNQ